MADRVRGIGAAAIVAALVLGSAPAGAPAADLGGAAPAAAVAEAVAVEPAGRGPRPVRSGAAISATAGVSIGDNFFDPETITIGLGDTVTWANGGTAPEGHTVTGSGFDSGVIEEGGAFSHRFDAAGVFDYVCELHDDMAGTVVVRSPSSGGGGPDEPTGSGDGGGGGGGGGGSAGGGAESGGGGSGSGGGTTGPGSESDAVSGGDAAGTDSSLPATGAELLRLALAGALMIASGLLLRRRSTWP